MDDDSSKGTPNLSDKKSSPSRISEKFKRPQMDVEDEGLLLFLGPKYKNDWKKIAKRIFNLRNKRYNPKFLMTRYKELVTDMSIKRIRFTHEEDRKLAKYFNMYGNDWNKIASHFESRTSIMLKNRYYSHIKKRNLLNKLLDENNHEDVIAEDDESSNAEHLQEEPTAEDLDENLDQENGIKEEVGSESPVEVIHLFSEKNEALKCRTVKLPLAKLMFEMDGYLLDQQLNEKVTLLPN